MSSLDAGISMQAEDQGSSAEQPAPGASSSCGDAGCGCGGGSNGVGASEEPHGSTGILAMLGVAIFLVLGTLLPLAKFALILIGAIAVARWFMGS
jgi:Flp pilus assembly protein TadB